MKKMKKRFVFFYFMKNNPQEVRAAVPNHIAYWHNLKLEGYLGGPFEDRSGGLIIFSSEDPDKAASLVLEDPFIKQDLVKEKWVKEWSVEEL